MTAISTPTGVMGPEEELGLLHLSSRFAGTFATEAALKALPEVRRAHGMVACTLDGRKFWAFDIDSSTSAGATVLVPDDAAGGRWHQVEDPDGTLRADLLATTKNIELGANGSWHEVDGTALAAFADADVATPGLALDDGKASGIRWNNHATPDPVCKSVGIPKDLDRTADFVVRVIASKTGETLADATTFDVGAFFNVVGALRDSDVDAGGATGAMTGDATSKTVQEVSVTIEAADVPDAGEGTLTITLQPTDGTLGTDDVTVHDVVLDYTRKITAS